MPALKAGGAQSHFDSTGDYLKVSIGQEGLLKRVGGRKQGYWEVTEQ